jgi:tetratricopeptide (TPR) repeat protein
VADGRSGSSDQGKPRGGRPSGSGNRGRPASSGGRPASGGRPSTGGRPTSGGRTASGGQPGKGGRSDRAQPAAPRRDRDATDTRRERAPRRTAGEIPPLPTDITGDELDPDVRRQLRTLPKGLAEEVAKRLVAAARYLEEDPELAHLHAGEATRIASRVATVRETNGLTAYATGRWAQARSELRAARRLSGSDEFLPILADCERGLGKPERALELAGSPEAARLDKATRVELRIVAAGARRDMGQVDAAVVTLQCPELRDESKPWSARLRYAYADALLAAGRRDEAVDWFTRAAGADRDHDTDAQERLEELEGLVFTDSASDFEADGGEADGSQAED